MQISKNLEVCHLCTPFAAFHYLLLLLAFLAPGQQQREVAKCSKWSAKMVHLQKFWFFIWFSCKYKYLYLW